MSEVQEERITVSDQELERVLLPRLTGRVFHVTSAAAFGQIVVSGVIRPNQEGKLFSMFTSRTSSRSTFGRRRGYVCLFDLREVTRDRLQEALMKCYFLDPRPYANDPVFLFLKESEHLKLLPWIVARGSSGEQYIPYVESWYSGDLPVSALAEALLVDIQRTKLGSGLLEVGMHEIEDRREEG